MTSHNFIESAASSMDEGSDSSTPVFSKRAKSVVHDAVSNSTTCRQNFSRCSPDRASDSRAIIWPSAYSLRRSLISEIRRSRSESPTQWSLFLMLPPVHVRHMDRANWNLSDNGKVKVGLLSYSRAVFFVTWSPQL